MFQTSPLTTALRNTRTVLTSSLLAVGLAAGTGAQAQESPGKGVQVQPLQSSIAEETFQTLLVSKALQKLGYDVQPIREVEYATAHVAIANGDSVEPKGRARTTAIVETAPVVAAAAPAPAPAAASPALITELLVLRDRLAAALAA